MSLEKRPFNKLIPVSFEEVEIIDDFWSHKQKIIREKAIYHQHQKLEEYHHINNFRIASGKKEGIFRGVFFFDSDLYKWLEAACYILKNHPDSNLRNKVDEVVELIKNAQNPDGYLNTYYSILFPDKKFSNLLIMHELYCMGHFFEAAVAHNKLTEKMDLINVASKCVDLLIEIFINKKLKGGPGHQEIELALIKLYRLTEDKKYLDLAQEFIYRRGNIEGYKKWARNAVKNTSSTLKQEKEIVEKYEESHKDRYEVERYVVKMHFVHRLKGFYRIFREFLNGKYFQLDKPVTEAREPVGHSVRALYFYTAVADLYSENGDKDLLIALEAIWKRMVEARMYITGGTGSIGVLEGFGKDFELSNKNSYSETCAAIGNMFWNWRMTQITAEAKYADLFERLMYNAMLVGPSLNGTTYMYNNPLESKGENERRDWYIVACCPANIARIISSIGGYIYSTSENAIWIHQYISSKASFSIDKNQIELIQKSSFPWKGEIDLLIGMTNSQRFSINLRIPKWCHKAKIMINSEILKETYENTTYHEINREWNDGDTIKILFEMQPTLLYDNPRVKKNKGKVVIFNGPLIYCLEQLDNKGINICNSKIAKRYELKVKFDPNLLGGINFIQGKLSSGKLFTAIPYHAWLNRGPNKMVVWIKTEN